MKDGWEKVGKTVSAEGTTITYRCMERKLMTIQSRKRHIPHANGIGTWDHTTYVVLVAGYELKEFNSLKDAKEYAEVVAE